MTNLKKLVIKAAIATSLVALVAGCAGGNTNSNKIETLSGIPVSVAETSGNYGANFSSVVIKDDEYILVSKNINNQTCSQANALVQSEINDGDNEKVTFQGNYKEKNGKKIFLPDSVEAQGYKINF